MKQTDRYLRGEMTEPEPHSYWMQLIRNPDRLDFLEFALLVYRYFDQRPPAHR